MKIMIWVLSALVALVFLAVGAGKLIAPAADLAKNANGVPIALLRFAGAVEVLGALGLILPAATRILPVLTPLAAAGLAVTMLGAEITNLVVGAYSALPMPAILFVVAAWLAWARFGKYAVQPRT